MKEISLWMCEVCRTTYPHRVLAELCEAHKPPPPAVEIGQEVRLKNRNRGHTVAVVRALALGADFHALSLKDHGGALPPEYLDHLRRGGQFHEWFLALDRRVYLDHKWETAMDTIPAFYLLERFFKWASPEEREMMLERRDNDGN